MRVKKGWSRNGPMQRILSKIFGTSNDRAIKRMLPLVERINSLEGDLSKLSDIDLRGRSIASASTTANRSTTCCLKHLRRFAKQPSAHLGSATTTCRWSAESFFTRVASPR